MRRVLPLALFALLLVACGSREPQALPLYAGTEGIALSFPQQNSFRQFTNDTFSVALRLENKGASRVGPDTTNPFAAVDTGSYGMVTALYDASLLDFQSVQNGNFQQSNGPAVPFALAGRDRYVSVGEIAFAEFTFRALPLRGNREKADAPVTFQVCYPYQSTFLQNACMDVDFYNTQMTKTCLARTLTDSSQGAPVAVTAVEPRFTKNEDVVQPRFKVTIRNVGQGYTLLYHPPSTDASGAAVAGDNALALCNQQQFDRANYGRVFVEGWLGAAKMSCGTDNNGIASFVSDTAEIVCRLESESLKAGANYEAPLTLLVHYIYIDTIQARVEITKEVVS